jgi:hypothetical protein
MQKCIFSTSYCKKNETSTALSFLSTTFKVEPIYRLWCLGGTFFSVIPVVKKKYFCKVNHQIFILHEIFEFIFKVR